MSPQYRGISLLALSSPPPSLMALELSFTSTPHGHAFTIPCKALRDGKTKMYLVCAKGLLHLLGVVDLLGLLGEEGAVNVGENTTLGDGDVTQELVQLLVVPDGELEMTGDDTGLLVVTGGVTSQFEDLSSEVLKDGSEVDGGTGGNTLGVVTVTKMTVETTDGELKPGLGGTGTSRSSSGRFASGLASSHC